LADERVPDAIAAATLHLRRILEGDEAIFHGGPPRSSPDDYDFRVDLDRCRTFDNGDVEIVFVDADIPHAPAPNAAFVSSTMRPETVMVAFRLRPPGWRVVGEPRFSTVKVSRDPIPPVP
jgi:hypothetical protein